jgi:hypothetical protein
MQTDIISIHSYKRLLYLEKIRNTAHPGVFDGTSRAGRTETGDRMVRAAPPKKS